MQNETPSPPLILGQFTPQMPFKLEQRVNGICTKTSTDGKEMTNELSPKYKGGNGIGKNMRAFTHRDIFTLIEVGTVNGRLKVFASCKGSRRIVVEFYLSIDGIPSDDSIGLISIKPESKKT
jgi:hypothetical protein